MAVDSFVSTSPLPFKKQQQRAQNKKQNKQKHPHTHPHPPTHTHLSQNLAESAEQAKAALDEGQLPFEVYEFLLR